MDEMSTSGAVPDVVGNIGVVRRVRPATLAGAVQVLRKKKKRLLKRFSKQFSPPLPSRIV